MSRNHKQTANYLKTFSPEEIGPAITLSQDCNRVIVIPKIVVEVAYNEIQQSPRYTSQMTLRFARITRIRDDKTPEEADTVKRV